MKIFVVVHRKPDAKPEEFAPHLEAESKHALGLYRDEIIREIYSRADGKGAILVLECPDEAAARGHVEGLPLAKLGLLSFDVYGAKPYRGIAHHAD